MHTIKHAVAVLRREVEPIRCGEVPKLELYYIICGDLREIMPGLSPAWLCNPVAAPASALPHFYTFYDLQEFLFVQRSL